MVEAHPILSCAEAAAWERRVLGDDAAAAWDAMGRAGAAAARQMLLDYEEIRPPRAEMRVLVLCGTGHNGGDALIAARHLLERVPLARANVVMVFGRASLKPLTQRALTWLQGLGERVRVQDWSRSAAVHLSGRHFDICIDGVVGMQFKPPLRDPAHEVFDFVAALGPQVELRAAVDLPSGVGDAGDRDGFRADFTYATGILKAPAVRQENGPRVGRVRYLDLGFFDDQRPAAAAEEVLLRSSLRSLARLREPWTDKRDYGHVFILGGSRAMPGAVAMAVMAAVRAGAGLVTAMVPQTISNRLAPLVPEAMWLPLPTTAEGALLSDECIKVVRRNADKAACFVMGPGLDPDREGRTLVGRIVREFPVPMVLDATALQHEVTLAVSGRPPSAAPVVFTPHQGELSRLAADAPAGYDRDFLKAFSARFRAVTLLKGPITHISDGNRVFSSPFGGPVLARGGSGDLLAGIIGALFARPGVDALDAVCRGAVWHGLAAEALARARGQQAVRTTELLDYLAPVAREA